MKGKKGKNSSLKMKDNTKYEDIKDNRSEPR